MKQTVISLCWKSALSLCTATILTTPFAAFAATGTNTIQFNRDIRRVLADNCFPCHGFDANKRKAELRLDTPEGATAIRKGHQAIKPGDLDGSELWQRITSTDPKMVMPPPETRRKLEPEQIALVKRWLQEGANYQKHWSFEPPVRPELPTVKHGNMARNDIDRFIIATLESKKLEPTPEAPKESLIRRVTLDLVGLPPTLAEVDAFLADDKPGAYERLVDRLLASPHYGEQMARYWLDLARYGDTHGLHLDNERSMWPYRDWVVSAFNTNLSYDQFTIWQLAGDLLPKPTREQLIASGYNRCNVSTSEGGAIDEEFQVRYAVDRVEATSTAWMGLTMGCAVCHDHKLDPITQKEFYEVFSIFNNISEKAMDGNALLPPPSLPLPTADQEKELQDISSRTNELHQKIAALVADIKYTDPATLTNVPKPEPKEIVLIEDDFPPKADVTVNEGNQPNKWITRDEGPVFSGEKSNKRSGKGLHQIFYSKSSKPFTVSAGDKFFVYVYLEPKDAPKSLMLQFHTDEWKNRANWGDEDAIPYGAKGTTEKVQVGALPEAGKWTRLEIDAEKLGLNSQTKVTGVAFTQVDGTVYWDKMGVVSEINPAKDPDVSFIAWQKSEKAKGDKSEAPTGIKDLLKKDQAKVEESEKAKLLNYYLGMVYSQTNADLQPLRAEIKTLKGKKEAVEKVMTSTMISRELDKPRPAWILVRGQYDKHGEAVGPGVPSVLPPLPESEKTNRLAFARWLVDPKHPLTARVTVNHFWQQFFGTGIVKTAEDFGTKGEWPSHPELLDFLATDFIASGWDVKRMIQMMVTSATYRQDSKVTRQLAEMDPENRLLARGPRHRLDAEELRDNALYLGGILNLKMGGRGVRTYQPPGIWEAVGYTASNTAKYTQDHGDALFRRSLYLFWKRTAPPPTMTTFDSPSREQCRARRERTNTPLQALATMNDPQYFEAARHFGYRILREGGKDDMARLRYGFRLATSREPSEKESQVLARALGAQRARYSDNPTAADEVISVGESSVPIDCPNTELAAYTMVANLLLNLDEVLTKN